MDISTPPPGRGEDPPTTSERVGLLLFLALFAIGGLLQLVQSPV